MKKLFLTAIAVFTAISVFSQYDYKMNKRTGRFDMVNELTRFSETITLTSTGANDTVIGKFTALDSIVGFDYRFDVDFGGLDEDSSTIDIQDAYVDVDTAYTTLNSTILPYTLDAEPYTPTDEVYFYGTGVRKYNRIVLYTLDATAGDLIVTLTIRHY